MDTNTVLAITLAAITLALLLGGQLRRQSRAAWWLGAVCTASAAAAAHYDSFWTMFCFALIGTWAFIGGLKVLRDIAKKKDIEVNIPELERELGLPIVSVNPRRNKGITQLKKAIEHTANQLYKAPLRDFINNEALAMPAIGNVKLLFPEVSDYKAIHYLINHESFLFDDHLQDKIERIEEAHQFNHTKVQAEEIVLRYHRISHIIKQSVSEPSPLKKTLFTEKLDDILLHRRWGYIILLAVLFLLFQSIFWLAEYPMNFIEWSFAQAGAWLSNIFPQAWWSDLIINGILAGVGGIVIFVPQIMILFGLISVLEDSGYMARISFLTDKLMRKVGLNGKSVMPMISGFACAVPAIMSDIII